MSDTQTQHQHTNRLINETSPYLLQHAHNPVDWYAWGEEALQKAKQEDKPILLSVGYSACHWCHVMERESFENEDIAAMMNSHFVPIKVDREERPDIDGIYMQAVQGMTGQGGWPMTVFLTPEGEPFYGGTYFPPEPRHGMPAFRTVLTSVATAYDEKQDDIARNVAALRDHLHTGLQFAGQPSGETMTIAALDTAMEAIATEFDWVNGGFRGAPKFPQPMILDFLLRQHVRTGSAQALDMAERTLQKMARGGLYDQLGGGFHRYSVDAVWLVPHFEKMLYDNALLVPVYLHAYQLTGNDFYRRVATETLDWVTREMVDAAGGFYATLDADSEGHEGKFYIWTPDELTALLDADDARLVAAYYDVTTRGNFEGVNILHVGEALAAVAERVGVASSVMQAALDRARPILLAAREKRVHPGRDEKVLTAWNGLMLHAFAEAAAVLDRADYRATAERAADFALTTLRRDGLLLRTYKDGQSKLNGYLEDYAFLTDGLLALYEATFDPRWLSEAHTLAATMVAQFWDDTNGGFFDTGRDHEALIARPKSVFDNAIPAGNSVAVETLQRLAVIYDDRGYAEKADRVLRDLWEPMTRYPTGFGRILCALDFALATPQEVALVGELDAPDTAALVNVLHRRFRPNTVTALRRPGTPEDDQPALLHARDQIDGHATASVCERYACKLPVTTPGALAAQLGD
ncbi:MAG: thioredoxin domain-containing protein [Chloroflexota bacterium]|nr:thioredoxin domain-containing protein [Chloroflexota bacterium]